MCLGLDPLEVLGRPVDPLQKRVPARIVLEHVELGSDEDLRQARKT